MAVPESMRFIDIPQPGGPDVLVTGVQKVPQPANGEVLLRVKAAGINRADLMQRAGNYPPPPGAPKILGLEVSGTVVAVGSGDQGRWHEGDEVCALLAGGGYAEYVAVPSVQCLPIPKGVSLLDAASLPEAVLTVWANLFATHRVFAGDLLLVQGGSSGVGSMTIQMARIFGARVAATAGTSEKRSFCLEMGAEKAIDYHGDWVAEAAEWAKPKGVDVILDMVAGEYFPKHLQLLGVEGRLVHIALAHGNQVTTDLRTVMNKRLVITGSSLRPRAVEQKGVLVREVEGQVWPLFDKARLRPTVFKVFPLEKAAEAHRMMEAGQHMGKIILEIG